MKLKSHFIFCQSSTSFISLLLLAGLSNLAMADNSAALKDSIKTDIKISELKGFDIKEIDSLTKTQLDNGLKKLDVNQDGKISLKEAVKDKVLTSQFDATDTDHDGMVSTDEYANYKATSSVKNTNTVVAPTANNN
jgi:Ca2+-binding EF-hand superfamily protein